jgi:hypothetical protein
MFSQDTPVWQASLSAVTIFLVAGITISGLTWPSPTIAAAPVRVEVAGFQHRGLTGGQPGVRVAQLLLGETQRRAPPGGADAAAAAAAQLAEPGWDAAALQVFAYLGDVFVEAVEVAFGLGVPLPFALFELFTPGGAGLHQHPLVVVTSCSLRRSSSFKNPRDIVPTISGLPSRFGARASDLRRNERSVNEFRAARARQRCRVTPRTALM